MKNDTRLLDLVLQTLCVMRIIKEYCNNNMDFDEHFENLHALSEVIEKNIENVLKNY